MRLCRDCKHAKRHWLFGWGMATCTSSFAKDTNRQTGKTGQLSCEVMRCVGDCGKDGSLWKTRAQGRRWDAGKAAKKLAVFVAESAWLFWTGMWVQVLGVEVLSWGFWVFAIGLVVLEAISSSVRKHA